MSVEMGVLRDLHRMLRQQADITGQIERGPKQLRAAQVLVDNANTALDECRAAIRAKKMEADRKQLQLREREAKILDLENKLNQAKANREYQTLKEQIAADTQANSVLSDEILEALEEIDALEQGIGTLVAKQAECIEDQKRIKKSVEERLAVLDGELKRVQGELGTVEATLDGDFKTAYFRIVPVRRDDAIAEIDGQSCGGCYTVLPPQSLDRLRMGRYVNCSSCGRMLYSPER